jgi:hypothetical protein
MCEYCYNITNNKRANMTKKKEHAYYATFLGLQVINNLGRSIIQTVGSTLKELSEFIVKNNVQVPMSLAGNRLQIANSLVDSSGDIYSQWYPSVAEISSHNGIGMNILPKSINTAETVSDVNMSTLANATTVSRASGLMPGSGPEVPWGTVSMSQAAILAGIFALVMYDKHQRSQKVVITSRINGESPTRTTLK